MHKEATLYRMVTPGHICPFGLKSKDLLKREGFKVDDRHLSTREETDAFKQKHGVDTTPQTFIDGQRVGGYDELRRHFNKTPEEDFGSRYTPVIATFALAALATLAFLLRATVFKDGEIFTLEGTIMTFIGVSMVLLSLQKIQDVVAFSRQFITYDLLGMKKPRYAYVYPFVEAYAGLAMIAGIPAMLFAPFSIFIGAIGAVSVIKAVYIDKRELKCACVGGNRDVPLGFISLTENLGMLGAGLWMLFS